MKSRAFTEVFAGHRYRYLNGRQVRTSYGWGYHLKALQGNNLQGFIFLSLGFGISLYHAYIPQGPISRTRSFKPCRTL